MSAFVLCWYIFLGCVTLGLLIGYLRREKAWDIYDHMSAWGALGVVLGLACIMTLQLIDKEYAGEKTEHYLYIYSLKNQNDIHGDFILGSGTVDSQEKYYFYWKSNYGYERGSELSHRVSLVESNRRPEIVVRIDTYRSKYLGLEYDDSERQRYVMYVPKGTVIKQFRAY